MYYQCQHKQKNTDLKQDKSNIQRLKIPKQPETQYSFEILHFYNTKSDPEYKSKFRKRAIDDEIKFLLPRNAFALANKKILSEANVPGGRFILD